MPDTKDTAATTAVRYYHIDEAAAKRANDANSFSDYKQGRATAAYRALVDKAVEIAEEQKRRVDPMYHDKIDHLLDLYARKLAENLNAGYAIEARCPSVLVAGPANFPVRKKAKQNAARDVNMTEWQHIQGLLDKIRSVGMGGISSDDPDAVAKLKKKLDSLQALQEKMKAANAYFRKHKTLEGCPDLTQEQIEKLTAQMAETYHIDKSRVYPAWALQNNNAEIRRIKQRIEELERKAEKDFTGWEFDSGVVKANKAENRLQIIFDAKPDADTRSELKANGFRWSPKAGTWQRQLNQNAYYAAGFISAIQPTSGEKPIDIYCKGAASDAATPAASSSAHIAYDGRIVMDRDRFSYETAQIGDFVSQDVVDDAIDALPPACMTRQCVQMGEPYSHREDPETGKWRPTYATFRYVSDGVWEYRGHCFTGETTERGKDPVRM